MKLIKRLEMVSSSMNFVRVEFSFKGFEVQREKVRLKSARIENDRNED